MVRQILPSDYVHTDTTFQDPDLHPSFILTKVTPFPSLAHKSQSTAMSLVHYCILCHPLGGRGGSIFSCKYVSAAEAELAHTGLH